jgi:hypothetical protein
MIKLVFLVPAVFDNIPKNPGDSKFFDEQSLDSIKELKNILSLANPLSNKVSIIPEHQSIYQLALTYFGLDELPMSVTHDSIDLLDPLENVPDNSFIKDTQVVVKKIENKSKEIEVLNQNTELEQIQSQYELASLPETILLDFKLIQEVKDSNNEKEQEEDNYSLSNELNQRRIELESTHHTKVKNLAEQYGITYVNKDNAIRAILHKEFEETAKTLGQEDVLVN